MPASAKAVEEILYQVAEACGANVLKTAIHEFGEGFGITGLALLSESHISIHTWPETNYIAMDIFTCGSCNPKDSIELLRKILKPEREKITEIKRG